MYTELTEKERKSILGNANFKGTFVCADSPVCHYCARNMFNDPDFDSGMCEECGDDYSNFLGIQCITWEDEDER